MKTYQELGFAPLADDWVCYINIKTIHQVGVIETVLSDYLSSYGDAERPATCQEIIDADGPAPQIGDWVVNVLINSRTEVGKISRLHPNNSHYYVYGETGQHQSANNIRPAHASEIPGYTEPEPQKPKAKRKIQLRKNNKKEKAVKPKAKKKREKTSHPSTNIIDERQDVKLVALGDLPSGTFFECDDEECIYIVLETHGNDVKIYSLTGNYFDAFEISYFVTPLDVEITIKR